MPLPKPIDLTLLRCLDALVTEAHVSRAADKLDMSQPAVSRVLTRLREMFGDPILLRTGSGMVATERAKELAVQVQHILTEIDMVVGPAINFDPRTSSLKLRLVVSDYTHAVFVPFVVEALAAQAPSVTLAIKHPVHPRALAIALEANELDFGIGHLEEPPETLRSAPLFEDSVVCMMRRGHPYLSTRRSAAEFSDLAHVVVTPAGYGHFYSLLDNALRKQGLNRHVAMHSQHFMAAPFIAERSDMVFLMPRRLALRYAAICQLEMVDLPLKTPPYSIAMYWHERSHRSAPHEWLRDLFRECAGRMLEADAVAAAEPALLDG